MAIWKGISGVKDTIMYTEYYYVCCYRVKIMMLLAITTSDAVNIKCMS